jgi:hypothetical protein
MSGPYPATHRGREVGGVLCRERSGPDRDIVEDIRRDIICEAEVAKRGLRIVADEKPVWMYGRTSGYRYWL